MNSENRTVISAKPEAMDEGNSSVSPEKVDSKDLDTMTSLRSTGMRFLELLGKGLASEDEIVRYVIALLDPNSDDANVFYLKVLATLPAAALQSIIVSLARRYAKPADLESRAALLFSLCKVIPTAADDEDVATLISETAQLLLHEAKRYRPCYCNAYREAAVMKFLPILLTRKAPTSVTMGRLCLSLIPDVTLFLIGEALKTIPESDSVCLTPEEIWKSLEEIFTEVLNSCCEELDEKQQHRKPVMPFWDVRAPSIAELTVWWINFQTSGFHGVWSSAAPVPFSFYYRLAFWSYLIGWYDTVKSESRLAERRPFLLRTPPASATPASATPENVADHETKSTATTCEKLRHFLDEKLEKILCLIQEVYCSIREDPLFAAVVDELQLEESSALYLSFQADFAILTGLMPPAAAAEIHPAWLRVQLSVSHVNALFLKEGLTATVFSELVAIFALLHRTRDTTREKASSTTKKRPGSQLMYVWQDCEILDFLCTVVVEHMLKQPLERASDEFLAALLVFIQPVLLSSVASVKRIVNVIGTREKFTFRRFFAYIVSPVVISEIAQVLSNGTVIMDLTMDPITAAAASVHKTRGANRGTTDALLLEMQRHIIMSPPSASPSNSYQAVALFMKTEGNIAEVVFQQANISPARRGGLTLVVRPRIIMN